MQGVVFEGFKDGRSIGMFTTGPDGTFTIDYADPGTYNEPLRPDPDRLLEQAAAPHRGKLKVFFSTRRKRIPWQHDCK